MMAGVAIVNARDASNPRRLNNSAFWGIYAVTFLAGSYLPDLANGLLVIAMVMAASVRGLSPGKGEANSREEREVSANRWGNKLFIPALAIPVVTVLGTVAFKRMTLNGSPLVDIKQVTVISLALATLVALAIGMTMLRPPPLAPIREARRLLDAVGWAAVLPQMLAALGALFALAGVGDVVGALATRVLPEGNLIAAVIVYALGMAAFTMIMGNAFAAFPVMAGAVGLPILIRHFHGDPAAVCAIGMLAGFCGTLMTPMAANFNIVPAALLELKDRNAVVKAQVGTAIPLLLCNVVLIWWLGFS